MRLYAALVMAALLGIPALNGSQAERLRFPEHGFSIEPPRVLADASGYSPLIMMLPPSGGFSPNVNVGIQTYPGSMATYSELTRRQVEGAGWQWIMHSSIDESAVEFEYAGNSGGRDLHWYAIGRKRGDRVYLVTATATESQWEDHGARLKASVQSFRLEALEEIR